VYTIQVTVLPVIINKGFITTVFAAIATYLLFVLRKRNVPPTENKDEVRLPNNLFRVVAIVLLFVAGAFEINYQFNHYYTSSDINVIYLLLYNFTFVYMFLLITEKLPSVPLNFYLKTILLALCLFLYLITVQDVFAVQRDMLEQHHFIIHFTAHWLGALMVVLIFIKLIALLRYNRVAIQKNINLLTWVICIVIVIFLSAEIHLLLNNLYFGKEYPLAEIQRVYIKAGLPILWGLCSFGFMWLGMRHKYRTLRIISLTLFSVTLLKLFTFDIRNIPVAGKIAAFFSLGILLLVISFMYQRLKKIIIEDEKKPVV
jgi:uncharacterized membrane protein